MSQAQTISCDLGSLAPGASSTTTITVMAPQQSGVIIDRAAAKADQTDSHLPRNRASLSTNVIPPPKSGI